MRLPRKRRESKTLNEVNKFEIKFVEDLSEDSEQRTEEVKDLIVEMILLARKRGRPKEVEEELANEAA